MKDYTDSLLEAYDIKESKYWRIPSRDRYNKTFWKLAKLNILDVDGFHAENDYNLKNAFGTNLTTLFDENGLLKNKASYGTIKNAKPDHTDSSYEWTLKALIRFWALQFKDNAITTDDLYKETKEKAKSFILDVNSGDQKATNIIIEALSVDKLKEDYLEILSKKANAIINRNKIDIAVADVTGEEKPAGLNINTDIKDFKISNISAEIKDIDSDYTAVTNELPIICNRYNSLVVSYTISAEEDAGVSATIKDVSLYLKSFFDPDKKDYIISCSLNNYNRSIEEAKEDADYADSEYNYKKLERKRYNLGFISRIDLEKFWDNARNNIICLQAFYNTYAKDINNLGLRSLFDSDGKLKSKSSYNELKAAEAQNPNSEAVKAALKLWELQFVTNAKTTWEIDQEKAEVEKVEKIAKQIELDKENKPIEDIIEKYNSDNGAKLNNTMRKLFTEHSKHLIDYLTQFAKIENRYIDFWAEQTITGSSKNVKHYNANIQGINIKDVYSNLYQDSESGKKYVSINLHIVAEDNNTDKSLLKISHNFLIYLNSKASKDRQLLIDIFNDKLDMITSAIDSEELLDKSDIDNLQFKYNSIERDSNVTLSSPTGNKLKELNAKILTAIDNGEQPDDNILNELESVINKFRSDAYERADIAKGPHDSGDSEAAYEYEIYESATRFIVCFKDLYWRSYNKLVPSWSGGTRDEFIKCLEKVITYGSVEDFEFRRAKL